MVAAILDYEINSIHIIEVPKELEQYDGDEIIDKMGFKLSDVNYMISEDRPSLIINTGVLATF